MLTESNFASYGTHYINIEYSTITQISKLKLRNMGRCAVDSLMRVYCGILSCNIVTRVGSCKILT